MIDPHLFFAYVAAVSLLMLTPGPDMMFVLATGARWGPRSGLTAALGVATSEAIHITLAGVGLAGVFRAAPVGFLILRIVGAAYLVWLGVQAIRSRRPPPRSEDASSRSLPSAYLRGFLTNLVNPKMMFFTLALLPQFVAPSLGHLPLQFAILGATFIAFELAIDGSVGMLAGVVASFVSRRRVRRTMDVASGLVMIGLGVRLATDRSGLGR